MLDTVSVQGLQFAADRPIHPFPRELKSISRKYMIIIFSWNFWRILREKRYSVASNQFRSASNSSFSFHILIMQPTNTAEIRCKTTKYPKCAFHVKQKVATFSMDEDDHARTKLRHHQDMITLLTTTITMNSDAAKEIMFHAHEAVKIAEAD